MRFILKSTPNLPQRLCMGIVVDPDYVRVRLGSSQTGQRNLPQIYPKSTLNLPQTFYKGYLFKNEIHTQIYPNLSQRLCIGFLVDPDCVRVRLGSSQRGQRNLPQIYPKSTPNIPLICHRPKMKVILGKRRFYLKPTWNLSQFNPGATTKDISAKVRFYLQYTPILVRSG